MDKHYKFMLASITVLFLIIGFNSFAKEGSSLSNNTNLTGEQGIRSKNMSMCIANHTKSPMRVINVRISDNRSDRQFTGVLPRIIHQGDIIEIETPKPLGKTGDAKASFIIFDMAQQDRGVDYRWSIGLFCNYTPKKNAYTKNDKIYTENTNNIKNAINKFMPAGNKNVIAQKRWWENLHPGASEYQFVITDLVPGYTWVAGADAKVESWATEYWIGSGTITIINPFKLFDISDRLGFSI